MLAEPSLRAVVRDLPLVSIPGPWARAVPTRWLLAPPKDGPRILWGTDVRAQRAYRFNPVGRFVVHYLAADYPTALAEVSLTLGYSDPYTVVTVVGVLIDVLDLTDPAVGERLGTNLQELTGHWRLFAAEGREAPT